MSISILGEYSSLLLVSFLDFKVVIFLVFLELDFLSNLNPEVKKDMLLQLQQSQHEKKSNFKKTRKGGSESCCSWRCKTLFILPKHSCITTLAYVVLFICLNCFLSLIRCSLVKSPHSNG